MNSIDLALFLGRCCCKLGYSIQCHCAAACFLHKFVRTLAANDGDDDDCCVDQYLLVVTCLKLACQITQYSTQQTNDHHVVKDILNVVYDTAATMMMKTTDGVTDDRVAPLKLDGTFRELHKSVLSTELIVLRALKFDIASFTNPSQEAKPVTPSDGGSNHDDDDERSLDISPVVILVHFLKCVKDVLNPHVWTSSHLGMTAWATLRDCFVSSHLMLDHAPTTLALGCLLYALGKTRTVLPVFSKSRHHKSHRSHKPPITGDSTVEEAAFHHWLPAFSANETFERVVSVTRSIEEMYRQQSQKLS